MSLPDSAESPERLYLDLMKRCLTDSIYLDDHLAGFVQYRPKLQASTLKRLAVNFIERLLSSRGFRLVEPYSAPWLSGSIGIEELEAMRESGRDWPARAHTMIGLKRLDNLQYCIETIIRDRVDGDFIETGVWRGGACIFMRAALKVYGDTTRTVWVADSFAGLPPPSESKYKADTGDKHHTFGDWLAVPRGRVEKNFSRYALLDGQVRFLEGWFNETLSAAPIERLALLRLDGDMYESTIQALDALYDKLAPGGFVIVDDYHLKPCAQAVHDFRGTRGIADDIVDIDGNGAYWRRRGT
jgi:O-methyltransferase